MAPHESLLAPSASQRRVASQAARILTLVSSLLAFSASAAVAPITLPPETLRQNLATALSVPVTQIVEAKAYRLAAQGAVSGVVLARYREANQAWTFPVLSVYYACEAGTCQSILRLGQAVERMATLALVDLEAPLRALPAVDPIWIDGAPRFQAPSARWPVLLLVSDVQRQEPVRPVPASPPVSSDRRVEHVLHVVSLQTPSAPVELHHQVLLERWPEEPENRIRPPRRIGRRTESIAIGRQGSDHLLVIRERDIDSQYSRGLRPQPETQTLRLSNQRFEIVRPVPSSPLRP